MSDFYQGKKVFIAGAGGLIGQALVRKLVPLGAKVTATEWKARKIDAEYRGRIEIISGIDLNYADHFSDGEKWTTIYEGQEIVFWCAARVGGARAIRENPSELIHYNLELAARNIKAAVDAGVERFGFIGSSYSYPDLDRPAKEEDVWTGDVPYIHYGLGWVKRYLETLCRHHHVTSNTKFAIIRPTAYYGPHDDFDLETCHVVPAAIRKVLESDGSPVEIWGDGGDLRQFTFVEDVAEGLLVVTENYCICEPLNICREEATPIIDLYGTVMRVAGRETLGVAFEHNKPTAIRSRISDPSRAKRILGFECKTSLEDGIRKTVEWYRKNHVEAAD